MDTENKAANSITAQELEPLAKSLSAKPEQIKSISIEFHPSSHGATAAHGGGTLYDCGDGIWSIHCGPKH